MKLIGLIVLLFGWAFAFALFLWIHQRTRFSRLLSLTVVVVLFALGVGFELVDIAVANRLPECLAYPWFFLPYLYIGAEALRFLLMRSSRKS